MALTKVGGVHIVTATKDGATEYWAVITPQSEAEGLVRQLLPNEGRGYTIALTQKRLTQEQAAALRLRVGGAEKLSYVP